MKNYLVIFALVGVSVISALYFSNQFKQSDFRHEINNGYKKVGAMQLRNEIYRAIIKNKYPLLPYQLDSVYNSNFK